MTDWYLTPLSAFLSLVEEAGVPGQNLWWKNLHTLSFKLISYSGIYYSLNFNYFGREWDTHTDIGY